MSTVRNAPANGVPHSTVSQEGNVIRTTGSLAGFCGSAAGFGGSAGGSLGNWVYLFSP